MRLFIGIDPGLTGAIAALDHHGKLVFVEDMPALPIPGATGTVKKQADGSGLARMLRYVLRDVGADEAEVLIERVSALPAGGTDSGRPRQGIASTFSLGDSAGLVRGVVSALGLRWNMVPPATWKRHYGLTRRRGAAACGQEQEDAKELSRAVALRLFPSAAIVRKRDHGRAEAILIAQYLRDQKQIGVRAGHAVMPRQDAPKSPVSPLAQPALSGFEAP